MLLCDPTVEVNGMSETTMKIILNAGRNEIKFESRYGSIAELDKIYLLRGIDNEVPSSIKYGKTA